MTPPLWQKVKRKKPLDESERREWKSWLKAQHSENEDHDIQSHHLMANRWENNGNSERLIFWAAKSLQMVSAAMKLKRLLLLGRKAKTNLDSMLKSRFYFADKGLYNKICGFSDSHICTDVRAGW